jgi:shikimate kinase
MAERFAEPASAVGAVALVGPMAAGKSVVGRLAAARLGIPFVDTDALIEDRAGNIPKIFDAVGESGFRRIERDVVVEVLDQAVQEVCIVALGGGAVLNGDVRDALHRLKRVVWLTAPSEELWRRAAAAGAAERPLARDEETFARLLAVRAPVYAEVASAEVPNDGTRPLETVVDAVVKLACGQTRGAMVCRRGEDAPG